MTSRTRLEHPVSAFVLPGEPESTGLKVKLLHTYPIGSRLSHQGTHELFSDSSEVHRVLTTNRDKVINS